ncbi:MAG: hypothetical protein K6E10_05035 [Eubacterium sp.]|nr:hypothetical protein [Eubacterium sp.]
MNLEKVRRMKNCKKLKRIVAVVLTLAVFCSVCLGLIPAGVDALAQSATPGDALVQSATWGDATPGDAQAKSVTWGDDLIKSVTPGDDQSLLTMDNDDIKADIMSVGGLNMIYPSLLGQAPDNTQNNDKTMELYIDLKRYNGDPWVLNSQSWLMTNTEIQHVVDMDNYDQSHWADFGYWYTIEYYDQNGGVINTLSRGSSDYSSFNPGPIDWYDGLGNDKLSGVASCKVIFHNVNGNIVIGAPYYYNLSKVVVDNESMDAIMVYTGEQPEEAKNQKTSIIIPFEAGAKHNITLYGPVTYNGTISFDSPDQSLTDDDYRYNFSFQLQGQTSNYSNIDVNNVYWNYVGDDTKHYGDNLGSNNNYYYFSLPIGEAIEIHNMPIDAMYHNSFSLPANNGIDDYSAPNGDAAHSGVLAVTLNGENIGDGKNIGLSEQMTTQLVRGNIADAYKYMNGDTFLPTSGTWSSFFLGEGFEINVSISRRPVQFMFSKVYAENDSLVIPEDLHHFEVSLYDTDADCPFTQKVAYYIYDSKDADIDDDADVQYIVPDAEGKFDVYLKAGQYIKVGRLMTPSLRKELGDSLTDSVYMPISDNSYYYFPGSGEIPNGIKYSIKEISDDYSASVSGNYDQIIKDGDTKHYYVATSYGGSYRNVNISELENIMINLGIEPSVFTNTRNRGSLSVEKIVKGNLDDDEFAFSIKLEGDKNIFPRSLDISSSLGNSSALELTPDSDNPGLYNGTFNLKAGEKITISGIPTGTKYSVAETSDPDGKYSVEYKDCEGSVGIEVKNAVITNTEIEKEVVIDETEKEITSEEATEEVTEEATEEATEEVAEEATEEVAEAVTTETKEETKTNKNNNTSEPKTDQSKETSTEAKVEPPKTERRTTNIVQTSDNAALNIIFLNMRIAFIAIICLLFIKRNQDRIKR